MKIVSYCRPFLKALLAFLILSLLALTICIVVLDVFRRFPLETLIVAGLLALTGLSIVLYIGELVVLGWVVDFLSEIGMPKIQARLVPLECEQVGEIIVVNLRDNIASVLQCQSVQKQLKGLIDEQHCDFVLDFSRAGKISRSFRRAIVYAAKAARREAEKLGKPHRPVALTQGASSGRSTTGNARSTKCPSTTGMDGLSSAASPLESERFPSQRVSFPVAGANQFFNPGCRVGQACAVPPKNRQKRMVGLRSLSHPTFEN